MVLIAFKYKDRTDNPDQSGFNKVGYVTQSEIVVFQRRNRVIEKKLRNITNFPYQLYAIPEGFDTCKLDTFFLENFQTPGLFHTGLASVKDGRSTYFDNPIKLPRLGNIEIESRMAKWRQLQEQIQKGDTLFTFDSKSLFSKLITLVDNGPWSHCGTCTGDGTVIEALTSGVVERPIDSYSDPRYRVGLYRVISGTDDPDRRIAFHRSQLGKRYNYRGAIIAGLRKLANRKTIAPTPNDLAASSTLDLVVYV
jgi:hypothetical protein